MQKAKFNQKLKNLRCLFFIIFCCVLTILATNSHAKPNHKYASLVMDADTGLIISQRYADKRLHPASLTKIMTLLITFEALDRGDISLNDRITISHRAAKAVPSKLNLPPGSRIKVKDAIYALVTKSANDVAVALAEHLGGSESRFAVIMTNRARSIGMNKTRYKNAHGLHHPKQITTARDQAKLARYVLKRYPHHYKYFSTSNFTYRGKTYRNHNRLMETYKGMDGFKTGYINASGFNLVASARQGGRRLIGVVFGGRSAKTRNAHMKDILNQGFKKARTIRVAMTGTPPKPDRKPLQVIAMGSTDQDFVMPIEEVQVPTANNPSYSSLSALQARNDNTRIVIPPAIPDQKTIMPTYKVANAALKKEELRQAVAKPLQIPIKKTKSETANAKRIETAKMIGAVHKGQRLSSTKANYTPMGLPPKPSRPLNSVGRWSVQIGAYTSRLATDNALHDAIKLIPIHDFKNINPMAVPLRTDDGMVFRARLGGLSRDEAYKVCGYLKNCMPIAPLSTRTNISQKKR